MGHQQPVLPQRLLGRDIFDVLAPLGFLDVSFTSPLGRRLRRRDPVIGTDLRRLARAGRLRLTPRVQEASGFRPNYSWLDIPLLDDRGHPVHEGGVTGVPGVSFLGLPWQRTRGSALLGGVGRDAEVIVRRETDRLRGRSAV